MLARAPAQTPDLRFPGAGPGDRRAGRTTTSRPLRSSPTRRSSAPGRTRCCPLPG